MHVTIFLHGPTRNVSQLHNAARRVEIPEKEGHEIIAALRMMHIGNPRDDAS